MSADIPNKILVVSLLRLGDILLSTAILRSLKKQYPEADLHILINGQYKSVISLIPYVTKVHTFEREGLQLEEFASFLQEENYDRVINLTHHHLSAWLVALIGCPRTQGPIFKSEGRITSSSRWFDCLSGEFSDNRFHFVDVFHYGVGLSTADRRIELVESPVGKTYAQELFKNNQGEKILIQAGGISTADWKIILNQVRQTKPKATIYVLGTIDEREIVEEICENNLFIPVIGELDKLFSVIQRSHLLITTRQTLKHFASATKIKILEINTGNSDFQKTGAYTAHAIIVKSKSAYITHTLISLMSKAMLNHDEIGLRALAHEFAEDATLFRTHINTYGDWSAYEIGHAFDQAEIVPWIDRSSSKLLLEQVYSKPVGEYGSEGLELQLLLKNIFPDQSCREWVKEFTAIEKQVYWLEAQITHYLTKLKGVLISIDSQEVLQNYISDLRNFCEKVEDVPVFNAYVRQLSSITALITPVAQTFSVVKKIREQLTSTHQRVKIEIKLVRNLRTGFMEVV